MTSIITDQDESLDFVAATAVQGASVESIVIPEPMSEQDNHDGSISSNNNNNNNNSNKSGSAPTNLSRSSHHGAIASRSSAAHGNSRSPHAASMHGRSASGGVGTAGGTIPSGASTPVSSSITTSSSVKRIYRTAGDKWVTRDIAALDFMLGIPLQAEAEIVHSGWLLQQQHESEDGGGGGLNNNNNNNNNSSDHSHQDYKRQEDVLEPPSMSTGRWWEKWVNAGELAVQGQQIAAEAAELERPNHTEKGGTRTGTASSTPNKNRGVVVPAYAPGRRLEGDEAVRIQIPLTTDTVTRQKYIARQAALREWELGTAHGLNSNHPPMLDGRVFFSAAGSYPVSVFSLLRYEPKKEEAALRRQKLEARGGGGTQFVMPARDWRGISYRSLLPRRVEKKNRFFNRFLAEDEDEDGSQNADPKDKEDDDSSVGTNTSDESDEYVPGILDDPEMVLGRHRNVMIGDRVTGPIVSSTIQFVKPQLLKADLNKQFRERFDGWEPPRSQRKFIGARVVDGVYTLMDPGDEYEDRSLDRPTRKRVGSIASMNSANEGPKEKTVRMPPSLTLSKIRSVKHQTLLAAVKAQLEIGTVALACVYFERLCLDCRVDKSNRRLSFAACLLLAAKLNEPNVGLVMRREQSSGEENMTARLTSSARPNKRSSTMFASLLEFFTQEWSLSLKHLFDAEWGVFAALGFSLHVSPSQVTFHFKRLMKTLEWSALDYLGSEMYAQWQEALSSEEKRRHERERRRDIAQLRKEEQLLNLHLEMENKAMRRETESGDPSGNASDDDHSRDASSKGEDTPPTIGPAGEKKTTKRGTMKLLYSLHRFSRPIRRSNSQGIINEAGLAKKRSNSQGRIDDAALAKTYHEPRRKSIGFSAGFGLPKSPSMPVIHTESNDTDIVAIDIPEPAEDGSEASSSGSVEDGICV
jgi:hypothetical protein